MISLSKSEAIALVKERASVIDGADNDFNLFATSRWLKHFVAEMPDDQRVVAFQSRRSHSYCLILLMQKTHGSRAYFSLTNFYASLSTPIFFQNANAEQRVQLIDDLAREIVSARPRIETINWHPVADDDLQMQVLSQALRRRGWFTRTYRSFGNWSEPTNGLRFADYLSANSDPLIRSWSRRAERLRTQPDASIALSVAALPSEVDAAMDAYERVYACSWKPAEAHPRFVRNWAHELAAHGELRLGLAHIAKQPVAAQFWVVAQGRAHIFKVAYDEEYARQSVGNILSAHMFKHVLDIDGVETIDYLSGDDPYKRKWTKLRKQRVGVVVSNPLTTMGFISAVRESAGAARQRFLRPSLA
jgi:ribosomal protein S18 acetylase RimI-like enzyme